MNRLELTCMRMESRAAIKASEQCRQQKQSKDNRSSRCLANDFCSGRSSVKVMMK